MVQIENLSKYFVSGIFRKNRVDALVGANLHLNPGEILGIMGPNGSGKTTLLKIISTLILPSEGRVKICGHDVRTQGDKVREVVSYVSNDDRSFFWRLSCWENLRFFTALNNISYGDFRFRIEKLTDSLSLGSFLYKRFDRCSSGMKRRLAIARALLTKPRLLLLDEPTNSLDQNSAHAVRKILLDYIGSEDLSVLYVTHQLQELKNMSCSVAKMVNGKIERIELSQLETD
jgi:ABC-2 type transport system ATP-binding protein